MLSAGMLRAGSIDALFAAKFGSQIVAERGHERRFASRADFRRLLFPPPIFGTRGMLFRVVRARHKLQIFKPIVGAVLVFVMHHFFGQESAPYRQAHHETVFKNVSALSCVRMIGAVFPAVPVGSHRAAALPVRVGLAFHPVSLDEKARGFSGAKPPKRVSAEGWKDLSASASAFVHSLMMPCQDYSNKA